MYAPGDVFADLAAAVATGRTASTQSDNSAATVSMSWARKPRRPRCGGASMSGSTPSTCRGCAAPGGGPSSGLGRRCCPRCQGLAAHRYRRHRGHRPLRQQRESSTDLEENLRSPPAADLCGPPRDRRGGALAGVLRTGRAGSNTAADHVSVLAQALASLPERWRPDPDHPDDPEKPACWCAAIRPGPPTISRRRCRKAGVGLSFGYLVDWRVQDAVDTLNIGRAWYPAIDTDGGIRDGAWVPRLPTWSTCHRGRPARDWSCAENAPTWAHSCGSPMPTECRAPHSSPTLHPVSYHRANRVGANACITGRGFPLPVGPVASQ